MKRLLVGFAVAALLAGCGQKERALTMITGAASPPYVFLRGQEIVGVEVEICRAVAARLERPFRAETVDPDSVIPAVVGGKADLAAAGITVTEERTDDVDFSIPYLKTGLVVICRKSNPYRNLKQLKGKRIGVQAGTVSETFVLRKFRQEPERAKSPAEACASLKSGRVDFVIADIGSAKDCVRGEPDLALGDFVMGEEYAVAIGKGQPELLRAINDTIAELRANGKLAKWIADYTAESDKLKER